MPSDWWHSAVSGALTPGILPSALWARLFKIAPGDFVCPSCGARRMAEGAALRWREGPAIHGLRSCGQRSNSTTASDSGADSSGEGGYPPYPPKLLTVWLGGSNPSGRLYCAYDEPV